MLLSWIGEARTDQLSLYLHYGSFMCTSAPAVLWHIEKQLWWSFLSQVMVNRLFSGKRWSNTKATFSDVHHIIVSASCLDYTLTSTWPQRLAFPSLLPTKLSFQRLFSACLSEMSSLSQMHHSFIFDSQLVDKTVYNHTVLNLETGENLLGQVSYKMAAVECGCFPSSEQGSEKYFSYLKVLTIHNRCAQTRLSSCLHVPAVPTFDCSPQTYHEHSVSCDCGVHEHREHSPVICLDSSSSVMV